MRDRTSPKSYVQLSLPSSLRIVLPIAFVYSTRPPVSVYGTVKIVLLYEDFLGNRKIPTYVLAARINIKTHLTVSTCLLLEPLSGAWLFPLRLPLKSLTEQLNTGILTCCPSATPVGLTLGPINPTLINIGSETLGFRRWCFSHHYATHTGILTSFQSSQLYN